MILTLTANPSVDRTLFIGSLERGAVIRSSRNWAEPSGKGVNVALALHRNGHPATAVLPVGGGSGAEITRLLQAAGLPVITVPVSGEIRSNVSLVEPDGTVTKVNETGPELTAEEVGALARATLDHLADVTWLACCGSLPPGAPVDLYAQLVVSARERGIPVVVDSSGAPLEASLAGRPDLIKPNSTEMAEIVGRSLPMLGDVVDGAQDLLGRGVGAVLVSLGADGAVLVTPHQVLHGEARVGQVVSTVGAGDAMLAGFLAGGTGRAGLASALAWGAAAVQHEGTLFELPQERAAVVIHDRIDRLRRLSPDS